MDSLPFPKDPDDMTPEERLHRIAELLAIGSIRLAEKERVAHEREKVRHNGATNTFGGLPLPSEGR